MFYCLLKGVFKNSAKIMIKANPVLPVPPLPYFVKYVFSLNCLCFNLKYSDKKAIISREFGFMGFKRDTDE